MAGHLEGDVLVDTRYSSWQNRQVRTIIVNSRSKITSQRSISNAMAFAKPYDRIEIVGGEYFETISVPFPLELVASEGEDVKISFRGTCLTLTSNCAAFISDIEFLSKSRLRNEAAVMVCAGTAEFSRCRMTNVIISGQASPTFHRCRIQNSINGVGVRVSDAGGGVLDSCDVTSHAAVCVEVDTLGELTVKSCTISQPSSSATVIAVQSVISNSTKYASSEYVGGTAAGLFCRQVKFVENRIFAREQLPYSEMVAMQASALGLPSPSSAQAPTPVLSTFGASCCALVSHEAQPVFEGNEFTEGSIGIIFERLGCAKLISNIFRMQRTCGIFFLLPDVSPGGGGDDLSNRPSVRITNHNFFDRCRIGIDVQCGMSGAASAFLSESEAPHKVSLSAAAAVRGHEAGVHSWLLGLSDFSDEYLQDPVTSEQNASDTKEHRNTPSQYGIGTTKRERLVVENIKTTVGAASEFLLSVVEDVLMAHPHVLRQAAPVAATPSGYLATQHASATFGFLTSLMEDVSEYRQSLRRVGEHSKNQRVAHQALEVLRGGFGIHIVETKFLNCSLCGVRFGHGGRGLVDACELDRCGAAAILSESSSFPMIVGCKFLNNGDASILMRDDADPFVVCNAFESSATSAIQARRFARGLVLGNVISGSDSYGLDIADSSATIVAHNFVTRNKKGGAVIRQSSRPLLLCNQFTGNFESQIEVSSFAWPQLVRNTVVCGGMHGILFTNCASGIARYNRIAFQSSDGIVVELDADPVLERNTIANNKGNGLCVRNDGAGSVCWNAFEENELYNIRLQEGGNAVIRANSIAGGFLGGLHASDEGRGTVEKNVIQKNGLCNVSFVGEHTAPVLRKNQIGECYSGVGVLCDRESEGEVLENHIHGNKICGVKIANGANPVVRKNSLFNESTAVCVAAYGRGKIIENSIYDVFGCGIALENTAEPIVSKNQITTCQMCGVQLSPLARGSVVDNDISLCGAGIISGQSLSDASLNAEDASVVDHGFSLTQSQQPAGAKRPSSKPSAQKSGTSLKGEEVADMSVRCMISSNVVRSCTDAGIVLESEASGVFSENTISQNGPYGILCDVDFRSKRMSDLLAQAQKKTDPHAVEDGSTSHRPSLSPAALTMPRVVSSSVGGGCALLSKNTIDVHTVANIAALHHGHNEFSFIGNRVSEAPCGVLVCNGSYLHLLEDNTFTFHNEGLSYEGNARGVARRNTISVCMFSGVYVSSGADPLLVNNRITQCAVAGVMLDAASRGHLKTNTVTRCFVGVVVCTASTEECLASQARGSAGSVTHASTCLVEDSEIFENQLHGVLVLGSAYHSPVRGPHIFDHCLPKRLSPCLPTAYTHVCREGDRTFPLLRRNRVYRNRFFGVFHERFQMLELSQQQDDALYPSANGGTSVVTKTPEKAHHKPHLTIQSPLQNKPTHRRQAAAAGSAVDEARQPLDEEPHLHRLIVGHTSLVDNDIHGNSFGVGVGQEMELFALRCNIHQNSFFGVLCRSSSRANITQCDIHDNGLVGVYASRFSMGSVSHCKVFSNNMLCRDPTLPRQHRQKEHFVMASDFCRSVEDEQQSGTWWRCGGNAKDTNVLSPVGCEVLHSDMDAVRRAYQQLITVIEVHETVLVGTATIMSDLVSAPSNALSVASSVLPNPFFSAAAQTLSATLGSGTNQAPSSHSMSTAMSFLDASNSAPVCDGGFGVWFEEGSQTEVSSCEISKHRHCGVLFSRGILAHHHILQSSYERTTPTVQLIDTRGVESPASQARKASRYAAPNPGVLFSSQTLINNAATAGSDATALDRTATFLDATSTSGVGSVTASPSKVYPHGHSPVDRARQGGLDGDARCTAGAPVLRGNKIFENERDGVRIQLFHALVASVDSVTNSSEASGTISQTDRKSTVKASGKTNNAKKKVSVQTTSQDTAPEKSASVQTTAPHVVRRSVPLPHLFDADVAALQFSFVVDDNDIQSNQWRGILCEHIAEVNCSTAIGNRVILNERFEEQASQLSSEFEASLRSGAACAQRAVRSLSHQRIVVEAGRLTATRHANIRNNDFQKNSKSHVECTTRFVVYTGDRHRTLLYMDTTGDDALSKSMFAFSNLMQLPLVLDMTVCPVPGIFLLDSNDFRDALVGVHLSGVTATQSTRIRSSTFSGLRSAGVLLDGPRAAACIGDGNIFEANRIGIHFLPRHQSQNPSLPSAPLRPSDTVGSILSAARVFKNVFRRNTVAGIVVEGAPVNTSSSGKKDTGVWQLLLPPPVVFRNLFEEHGSDSSSVIVKGLSGAVWLNGNHFRKNAVGLVLSDMCGDRVSVGSPLCQRPHKDIFLALQKQQGCFVEQNRFEGNIIGCLVCNASAAALQGNLFRGNRWSGCVVTGSRTYALIHGCCFEAHNPERGTLCPPLSDLAPFRSWRSPGVSPSSRREECPDTHFDGTWTVGSGSVSVLVDLPFPSLIGNACGWVTPCGLLADSCAAAVVEETLFMNNDIGFDLVRDVCPIDKFGSAAASNNSGTSLAGTPAGQVLCSECVFRGHAVAGFCCRGLPHRGDLQPKRCATAPDPLASTNRPDLAEVPAIQAVVDARQQLRAQHADAEKHRGDFSALVSASLFEDNGLLSGGDVVFTAFGHADMNDNCFLSTVRLVADGYGRVRNSLIRGSKAEVGVVLEEGARTEVVNNIIRDKQICLHAQRDSFGIVRSNLMTNSKVAVETDPFCSTVIEENVIALMEDCAMVLRGGIVQKNTMSACPVGVIIRNASTAPSAAPGGFREAESSTNRGASAISSTNYQVQFLDNVLHSCDSDGLLVSGGGNIEGNHISNCKTNVTVVCDPSVVATSQSMPRITKNYVFDATQYGVVLTSHAAALFTQNDVFDNAICGVVLQPFAKGIVEGNHISSAQEHGALEISPEAACEVHRNTVKNQFSPAYNKGLAAQRLKERSKEAAAFAVVLGEADARLSSKQTEHHALSQLSTQLYNRLCDGAGVNHLAVFNDGDAREFIAEKAQLRRSSNGLLPSSFESFESMTSALTNLHPHLRDSLVPSTSSRTLGKRSQSLLSRVRNISGRAASGSDAAGSSTASTVLRDARRASTSQLRDVRTSDRLAVGNVGGRSQSGDTALAANSQQHCAVLIHVLRGSGFSSETVSSRSTTPKNSPRIHTSSDAPPLTRNTALHAAEVGNVCAAAFHAVAHSNPVAVETVVTTDASEVVLALKARHYDVVLLAVPPPRHDVVLPEPPHDAATNRTLVSQLICEDPMLIPRLGRLLGDGTAPSARTQRQVALLLPQVLAGLLSVPPKGSDTNRRRQAATAITFREFVSAVCDVREYDTIDDLETRVLPILRREAMTPASGGNVRQTTSKPASSTRPRSVSPVVTNRK